MTVLIRSRTIVHASCPPLVSCWGYQVLGDWAAVVTKKKQGLTDFLIRHNSDRSIPQVSSHNHEMHNFHAGKGNSQLLKFEY